MIGNHTDKGGLVKFGESHVTQHCNIAADMDPLTVKAVKRIGFVETKEEFGIAVRKEDTELLTKLKSDLFSSSVN